MDAGSSSVVDLLVGVFVSKLGFLCLLIAAALGASWLSIPLASAQDVQVREPGSEIGQGPVPAAALPKPEAIQSKLNAIETEIKKIQGAAGDLTAAVEKHKVAVARLEKTVVERSRLAAQCKLNQAELEAAQKMPGMTETTLVVYRQTVEDCQKAQSQVVVPVLVEAKNLSEDLKKELEETER